MTLMLTAQLAAFLPGTQAVSVAQCARRSEVVVPASLAELPLTLEPGGDQLPPDAQTSPSGAWRFVADFGAAPDQPPRHPTLLVQPRGGGPVLRLSATSVPGSRPIFAEWLSRDLVCVLASFNPAATAAWVVDLRRRKVLAAGSLQAVRP